MSSSSSSSSSPYAPLLDNLRLPHPSLQRYAVVSLFQKLLSSPPPFHLRSHHARDAISLCLRSPSPAVADQAVREICRLSDRCLVPHSLALSDLQSALESCDPAFVGVFIKGIGFLCRSAFRNDADWGRRFDPVELHPFIKVLSSREEVETELIQQVLLFIVHNKTGMEEVKSFLRPFLLFSVIQKPFSISSSMFTRSLVSSIASLACSLRSEAIGIIKFLTECLKYFPCNDKMEFRYLIVLVEYVVDALVVVLKHIAVSEMQLAGAARACSVEVLDVLFSLCSYMHRPHGGIEIVVELSKRLLATQKELGLPYMPDFSVSMASVSVILYQLEFEHEQLSILKLLIFLFQWRAENEYNVRGPACYLREELLFIFPVISLLSSPSKSVKTAAAFLLSALEKIMSGLLSDPVKKAEDEVLHMWNRKSIPFRLLSHLWFQDISSFPQSTYLRLTCSTVSEGGEAYCKANYWTSQLATYLSTVKRLKVISRHQSTENLLAGMHLLLSSIASILIIHPMLGSSALDSLAAIGQVDPKMGMPLLQAILFFNKLLSSHESVSPEMLLKLLETITSLASHTVMVPLIVQMILPMLQQDAKPLLHAAAIRLLCKTWIITDRVFGTLQEALDPKAVSDFISEREICISIAGSIRDVCRHNPDRGVDLILSVSSCIESQDSTLQALGFESLAYLCEADVVDFYTAWDVIAKHMLDYTIDPIVAHGLCTLLRWGAMDVAAYPERSKTVVQILWEVGTSRNGYSSSLWVKARTSAFKSLSHYEVDYIHETLPDFKEHNFQCLTLEDNAEILMAMEEFEIKIINFEHINRRRVHKQKRTMVHKVEKLLDVFPQVMFSQGNKKFRPSELPGAALLSIVFTPKDIQGTSKDLGKLHSAYEKALLDISESLHVSRNILVAHLALQSWKAFFQRWIREAVMYGVVKESSNVSDKITRTANDIFKILCKVAAESIPRVAINIALAIGAFCSVLPPTTHFIITAASDFLLKWLVEYEHEHQQWSAAISLGEVSNCLHATDKLQKLKIITELLKALSNSRSYLVKGACGFGLGLACQVLLSRIESDDSNPEGNSTKLAEMMLLQNIIRKLSVVLSQLCPSASDSLQDLNNIFMNEKNPSNEDFFNLLHENSDLEEDAWGIAGLVIGLGNSVLALYRAGAYDAMLKIKEMLISWFPQVESSVEGSIFRREMTQIPLAMGSCLALPTVIAFCHRTELINNDFGLLVNRYGSLISELLCSKKSGTLYQNLLMASCVGAGSFLSCILGDGLHSMAFDDVKCLLQVLRDAYTHPHSPSVQFGGMLGVVNALGAGAGDLTRLNPHTIPFQLDSQKDTLFIRGPLLSSSVSESLSTSMIQELFLLAKESIDPQIRQYSAWSISFLREKLWPKDIQNTNSKGGFTDSSVPSQNFPEDSIVLKLCLWLRDIDINKLNTDIHASTVSTVLRCLSKAPRLPALDWGAIIRRCMRYGSQFSTNEEQASKLIREECICFSLAHANDVSSLLLFLDELTDLSRFSTLELNLQSAILYHLSDILEIFSGSRLEKLVEDLVAYFSSSVCSYLSYNLDEQNFLRVSFWKGLRQCLDGTLQESTYTSNVEKCMECLFSILPMLPCDASSEVNVTGSKVEWSEAIRCLSMAPQSWLMDFLQVPNINTMRGLSIDEAAKRVSTIAKLVRIGCIPISVLEKIKSYILNVRSEGMWWNVLMDVAAAVSTVEDSTKSLWLLDALEISCVAEYPSTALQFIGIISGICCKYMPLLVVDPNRVLSDLPVTLPSLLSESSWGPVAESVADKLWASTERICNWAAGVAHNEHGFQSRDGISDDEAHKSALLARSLHQACLSLKDYLPLQKQLRLALLELPLL